VTQKGRGAEIQAEVLSGTHAIAIIASYIQSSSCVGRRLSSKNLGAPESRPDKTGKTGAYSAADEFALDLPEAGGGPGNGFS
jgi:hypothetical protein